MTNEMMISAIEKAQTMSKGRSFTDIKMNGAIVILSNGTEVIVDYMAASWAFKGFWIDSVFENGLRVY